MVRKRDDPRLRSMTTIYLPEAEGEVFATLKGLRTTKRRYEVPEQGFTFCVDVWEKPVDLVAEVEADSLDALAAIRCPVWAEREVTDDPRYSAIALARRGDRW